MEYNGWKDKALSQFCAFEIECIMLEARAEEAPLTDQLLRTIPGSHQPTPAKAHSTTTFLSATPNAPRSENNTSRLPLYHLPSCWESGKLSCRLEMMQHFQWTWPLPFPIKHAKALLSSPIVLVQGKTHLESRGKQKKWLGRGSCCWEIG